MNKINLNDLKKTIDGNCEKYIKNIKKFNEEFYPTLMIWLKHGAD